MGFGGSAQAMITVLKNNDKLRKKRDKFKRKLGGNSSYSKPEYNFPKATPRVLEEIKRRLNQERKVRLIKICILTTFLALVIVYFLLQL